MKPRITVITPCSNQALFIERAICSVIDQGYENLEYFVVDGESVDGSTRLITMYEDELTAWWSRQDECPAEAINHALSYATGEIVIVVNADDVLMPGALDAAATRMTGRDAPEWLIGECLRIDGADHARHCIKPAVPDSLDRLLCHDAGVMPSAATFFRRSLLQRVGPFDTRMHYAYHYEMQCRLFAAGVRPGTMDEVVAGWREQDEPRTPSETLQAGMEFIEAAMRYSHLLRLRDRLDLWRNCDRRRRIYALAELETESDATSQAVWRQLLRHPWWLADVHFRQTLTDGVRHPVPEGLARAA